MARPSKYTSEQLENITKAVIKNRKAITPLGYTEIAQSATQLLGLEKPMDLRLFSRCQAVVSLVTIYNQNLVDISSPQEGAAEMVIEEHLIPVDKVISSCHSVEDIRPVLLKINEQLHQYSTNYEEMFGRLNRLHKEAEHQKTSNAILAEQNRLLKLSKIRLTMRIAKYFGKIKMRS